MAALVIVSPCGEQFVRRVRDDRRLRDCVGAFVSGGYDMATFFGPCARPARLRGSGGVVVPAGATWAVTLQPSQKQKDISQDY
jgi:hypothetical protein